MRRKMSKISEWRTVAIKDCPMRKAKKLRYVTNSSVSLGSPLSLMGMYMCFSVLSSSTASLNALDPLEPSELPIWLWSGEAVLD